MEMRKGFPSGFMLNTNRSKNLSRLFILRNLSNRAYPALDVWTHKATTSWLRSVGNRYRAGTEAELSRKHRQEPKQETFIRTFWGESKRG